MTSVNRYATDDLGSLGSATSSPARRIPYDDASDLTGLKYVDGASNTVAAYRWDYNTPGIVADFYSRNDTTGTPGSTYSSWGKATYSYDATAQFLGASYNGYFANAPTSDNGLTYDPNGNRTTATPPSGAATTTGADNRVLFDGIYTYHYDPKAIAAAVGQ